MDLDTPEINHLLKFVVTKINNIFEQELLGVYLFGSLSYGDFVPGRSDIDLLAVIKRKASESEVIAVEELFQEIGQKFQLWKGRVECSFTPASFFKEILPPVEPRPYFGEKFYKEATYGNEWLINNYLIQEHGIKLFGGDFKALIPHIAIKDVQEASRRDLLSEWVPKLDDPEFFKDSHYQSYLVLNLCRILYTLTQAEAGSKKTASSWVANNFPERQSLIEEAQHWEIGKNMDRKNEVENFLKFAISITKPHNK